MKPRVQSGRKKLDEQKKTEQEQSYRTLREILSLLPGHIYWKNRDGILLGCNLQQAKDIGLNSVEEIEGKTTYDFIYPNQPETDRQNQAAKTEKIDQEIMRTNKAQSMEEFAYLPDGTEAYYWTMKAPLHDKQGKVIGIVGTSININERKKLEEELKKSKTLAEAASQAKTEFLENMRHDIRTPLTGIVGFAEIIKNEIASPEVREYVDNLVASSHALLDLMDEVLEAVRVSSGEIPRLKKKFSLQATLQHVIDLNKAKALSKKLDLSFHFDAKLPKYVLGDNVRLHRIALELVANALNFTDKGFVKLSILLAKKTRSKLIIKILVEDSGMGIPAEKQQEIFLQFKRLTPSYQGIYKGAGLGLAVIKQFIDDLDGEIYVESSLHQGSVFSCILPLQIPLLDDDSGVLDIADLASLSPESGALPQGILTANKQQDSTGSHRVLVVEDNSIAQMVAKNMLAACDCMVDIADKGQLAVELWKTGSYDLIFMDIGLPDMDGYEVTQQIRLREIAKKNHIPIIALTAHAGDENKQRCIEAGMNAVLSKPLTQKNCQDIVDSFIPSKKAKNPEDKANIYAADLPASKRELFDLSQFPLLDTDEGLKTTGTKELLARMLQLMVDKSLPEDIALMGLAHQEANWEKVAQLAHKIKGGVVYVGLVRLKMACQYLERYWKSGQREAMEELYKQAVVVVADSTHSIRDWLLQETGKD